MSHHNAIRPVAVGAIALIAVACAARAPVFTVAPDDASCRMVTDTTEQRVPPRWLSGPEPKYPVHLRNSGVQGQVVMEYVVGCNGDVRRESVVVLSFTHEDLVKPALTTVVGAKFAPALIDGRPVAVRTKQSVRFTIGPPRTILKY